MIRLPRNAQLWLPGYIKSRARRIFTRPPAGQGRVWLAIADHYEPYYQRPDDATARARVALWTKYWPEIARRHTDSAGRHPKYNFFYPQEEYRPELLDALAEFRAAGTGEVEIHIHHDGEGEQDFIDRMSGFIEALHERHGLLRKRGGRIQFGFIHGNWALDNSRPDGRWCGLNNEITLLRDLGCYADFTMPSGSSPTQARTVNTIYWATDDPMRPRSYDYGEAIRPGRSSSGDLLMIPGPFCLRWRRGLPPRMDSGEIASYDPPSAYRVKRWLDTAPGIGNDIFIKLYTHGTQERHSTELLLNGGLDRLFRFTAEVCRGRGYQYFFCSTWEMRLAVEAAWKEDTAAIIQNQEDCNGRQIVSRGITE
jgi:hypothetical protein